MGAIELRLTKVIHCPADVVARQFLDIDHHARHPVHAGVRFEVLERSAAHCVYEQVTAIGPLRFTERSRLDRDGDDLVNRCLAGATEGLVTRFSFVPAGSSTTEVVVVVRLDTSGSRVRTLLAPVLRALLRRGFTRALEEDRVDLERHGYPR